MKIDEHELDYRPEAPESDAPNAAPMKADSLMGVSITRSPNFSHKPFVTPRTPPQASILPVPRRYPRRPSSPISTMRESRSISCERASLIDC